MHTPVPELHEAAELEHDEQKLRGQWASVVEVDAYQCIGTEHPSFLLTKDMEFGGGSLGPDDSLLSEFTTGPTAVTFKHEADASIGFDGRKFTDVGDYIKKNMGVESKPLDVGFTEEQLEDLYDVHWLGTRGMDPELTTERAAKREIKALEAERDALNKQINTTDLRAEDRDARFGIGDEFAEDLTDTEDEYESEAEEEEPKVPEVPEDKYGGRLTTAEALKEEGADMVVELNALIDARKKALPVLHEAIEEKASSPEDFATMTRAHDINTPGTFGLDEHGMHAAEPGGPARDFGTIDEMSPTLGERLAGFWGKVKDTFSGRGRLKGELAEPLLSGAEMLPLKDRPSAVTDAPAIPTDVKAGITELAGAVIKDPHFAKNPGAAAAEMGFGLGAGGGFWIQKATFKDYLMKQGKGLLAAPVVAALTMWLNTLSPDLGDYVSLAMVVADVATSGDPLGVVLYGLSQLWDAGSKARQKVLDNDNPDSKYGSRLGYVREGDKWYPAVLNSKFESTGLFATDASATMNYGNHLIWFWDGSSKWVPGIANAKSKDFVMSDSELDRSTTKALGIRFDGKAMSDQLPVRDWYFLSDEDSRKVASGDFAFAPYEDDVTTFSNGKRQVNDWRKALEFGQDWKWGTGVDMLGPEAHVNAYEGSRELARLMRDMKDVDPAIHGRFGASGVVGETIFSIPDDSAEGESYDDFLSRRSKTKVLGEGWTAGAPLNDYLLKTVMQDHMRALYRAQRRAAESAGFDKLYGSDAVSDPESADLQTVWSSFYLDTAKDLPVAKSADELHEQLHSIEMYDDRTTLQRNYLAQKAMTRYWMQAISDFGGADEMTHMIWGRDSWGPDAHDPYFLRKDTLEGLSEYEKAIGDEGESVMWLKMHDMPGWVAPWQNKGEDLLPDLARGDATMEDLLSDYRYKNMKRMSTEATEHFDSWINTGSRVDPSVFLDTGEHRTLDGSLTDPVVEAAPAVEEPTVDSPVAEEPAETVEPVKAVSFEDMMKEDAPEDPEKVVPSGIDEEDDEPEELSEEVKKHDWIEEGKRLGWIPKDWVAPSDEVPEKKEEEEDDPEDVESEPEDVESEPEDVESEPEDVEPERPTDNTSHKPDTVPKITHAVSLPEPGYESLGAPEHFFLPMTAGFEQAVLKAEAPPKDYIKTI